jgi:hypothetical protein
MKKSISEQLSSKYQNSFRLTAVTFLIALVFILNQAHNGQIANETKGRDNSYYSWRALTSHDSFFSEVNDRDIFISKSQNDAYETNAGSFFHFTGIRLVYIFRTVSIWPEIENCSLETDCVLDKAKERVVNILPTLNRLGPDPQNDRQMTTGDWVKENLRAGILDQSKIWLFDIFPMTANTSVAYLGQNLDTNASASVNAQELRVATMTRGASLEFRPSISGLCLEEMSENKRESKRSFGVDIKLWRVSQNDLIGDPKVLDFRSLNMGTC